MVVAEVSRGVRHVASGADLDDIDAWWQRVVEEIVALLAAGWALARDLAELFLGEHARIEGHEVTPTLAEWNTERVLTALRVTGPVAFKEHIRSGGTPVSARVSMANQLAGSSERLAMAGERETVEATIEDSGEIVGYRRVGDSDPCAWCAMLIGRGAVYKSRRTAGDVLAGGNQYHDNDGCTVEPLYEHEDEPAEVADLYQQWLDVTAGKSGKDAIGAWRRYWEGRGQDAPADEPAPDTTPTPAAPDLSRFARQDEAPAEPEAADGGPDSALSWLDDDEDEDWAAIMDAATEPEPDPAKVRRAVAAASTEPRPTVDINDLVWRDDDPPEKEDLIEAKARELFDGEYAGIRAQVDSVSTEFATIIEGTLFDGDREVGRFVRAYQLEHNPQTGQDDLVAHHEILEIDDKDLRGQGFAQAFNSHLEASYRASGVDHIALTANIDVGGYTWARHGYDWADDRASSNIMTSLDRLISSYERAPGEYPGPDIADVLEQGKALVHRFKTTEFGGDDYPTPYEVSQLGRWAGAGRDDRWLGKLGLLGRTWDGVKPL